MPRPPATGQFKAAKYGLKCGDRSFAEYYARNAPKRARAVREYVEILNDLGWLTPAAQSALGLVAEQLTLDGSPGEAGDPVRTANGSQAGETYTRLGFSRERLREAGANGLRIWSLVTEVGEHEGSANPRDRNWRAPVAAELDEYADRGIFVREGDRLYLPECAPVALQ